MSIARVQGPFRGCASNSSVSVSLSSTPKYDNLLIATIGTYGSYPPYISSISQTGVSWSQQVESTTWVMYGRRVAIWAGVVTSTSASTNITITLGDAGSGASADPVIADICEYQGLQTTNFLDKTATKLGTYTRTLETNYTATTTRANELWVGAIFNVCNVGGGENSTIPTNNFALLDGQGVAVGGQTKSLAYLEKIVSTTGIAWSGCYGGSYTTYEAYCGCIATFKGTVNNDSHLYDETKWEIDTNYGSGSRQYDFDPSSYAYTKYDATSRPADEWGNTEYEQAYDIFRTTPWGSTWYAGVVPLTQSNQKVTYSARLDEIDVLSDGQGNAYINLWIMFPTTGTGTLGYKYGEIELYIHKSGDSSPGEITTDTRYDSTVGSWYFVGKHTSNLSTSDFTATAVDLTPLINQFNTTWGCNLSTGGITGITFGVECAHAKLKATFDYVKYQY